MPKVLITGVNGFVGHHLTRELKANDCEVYGVGMQPGSSADLAQVLDGYYSADLTDMEQVEKLPLADMDAIISLAGLAKVGESFKNPDLYMRVNTLVVSNISKVLLEHGAKTRHLAISTGAVYDSGQRPPFAETGRLAEKESPYVMSKIAMEKENQVFREEGLDVVIARPFNHIGPGQESGFLLPDLTQEVRQALSGNHEVRVGNLDTKRDYTDVRDVVRAYRMLALAKSLDNPIYNVCSGRSIAGKKILSLVLKNFGAEKKVRVVVDDEKFRPSDAPDIFGDNSQLLGETGWSPTIPVEQTVADYISSSQQASDDEEALAA